MKTDPTILKPLISHYNLDRPTDWPAVLESDAPLIVEIGFGMGEFIVKSAQERSDCQFIGIEQHWERIYKTLKRIDRNDVPRNIHIFRCDAQLIFDRYFPPKSIDEIYCLFPCPWPKKSHVKYRLFSSRFIKCLNNRLKDKGTVTLVTDFKPYRDWVVEQSVDTGFAINESLIKPQFDTKFEKKWCEQGQEDFFEIVLTKDAHIDVPVIRDQKMKTYKLKELDLDNFKLNDLKGETSVIFKDKFIDRKENKMLIRAIVSEGYLTQHFWISVALSEKGWQINRADGQNFFPSPGTAKALDVVYESLNNEK